MKRKIIAVAFIAAAMLFVAAMAYLLYVVKNEVEERTEYVRLADEYVTVYGGAAEENMPSPGQPVPGNRGNVNRLSVDFDALSEINGDIVGWIYSEGTPINYPIVQASDNSYYLKRSFEQEESKLGAIFLDAGLDLHNSDVVILYGHNMGTGRNEMFSSLKHYEKDDYFEEHEEIITLTKDGGDTLWYVFAVMHISVEQDEAKNLYRRQNFANDEQYRDYIQCVKSNQLLGSDITPNPGHRILLLSTCVGNGMREMRRLVFAVEVIAVG